RPASTPCPSTTLFRSPAYGSIVDKLAPAAKGTATFVSYPHVIADGSITPGQHASFLGKAHNPLFVNQDPSKPDFKLPELTLPERSEEHTSELQSPDHI